MTEFRIYLTITVSSNKVIVKDIPPHFTPFATLLNKKLSKAEKPAR